MTLTPLISCSTPFVKVALRLASATGAVVGYPLGNSILRVTTGRVEGLTAMSVVGCEVAAALAIAAMTLGLMWSVTEFSAVRYFLAVDAMASDVTDWYRWNSVFTRFA